MALSQIPAGILAERWGERRLLVVGTAVTALGYLGVATLHAAGCSRSRRSSSWPGSAPASSTPWPPRSSRARTRPARDARRSGPTTSRATSGRSPCPAAVALATSAIGWRFASGVYAVLGLGGHRLHRPRPRPDRGGHGGHRHARSGPRAAEAGASGTRAASRRSSADRHDRHGDAHGAPDLPALPLAGQGAHRRRARRGARRPLRGRAPRASSSAGSSPSGSESSGP